MSYKQWREETIHLAGKHGIPHSYALRFLRWATTLQRSSEISCSFEETERQTTRREKRDARIKEMVRALASECGFEAEMNGDPRGNPFFLFKPCAEDSEGHKIGPRVSFPGNGLPARCFR